MINTYSIKSPKSGFIPVKYISWTAPFILLSILAIVSFYDDYKFNSVILVSKYVAIFLFIISLIIFLSDRNIDWVKMVILLTFLSAVSLISLYNMPIIVPGIYFEAITNIVMYVVVATLAIIIFPKIYFEEFKILLSVLFVVLLFFVTVPSLANVQNLEYYTSINDRLRYVGIFDNPNELGRFALLGSLLSLRLWFLYKGNLKKSMFIFMFATNTYLIYLSDSRTSMVSVGVLILLVFFIWLYKNTPKFLFISLLSIIFSAFLVVIFYYSNVIGINSINNLNELSSGRLEIWKSILNTDLIGYLFGTGPMLNLGSHNGYLEILKYFGLFGLLFSVIY